MHSSVAVEVVEGRFQCGGNVHLEQALSDGMCLLDESKVHLRKTLLRCVKGLFECGILQQLSSRSRRRVARVSHSRCLSSQEERKRCLVVPRRRTCVLLKALAHSSRSPHVDVLPGLTPEVDPTHRHLARHCLDRHGHHGQQPFQRRRQSFHQMGESGGQHPGIVLEGNRP